MDRARAGVLGFRGGVVAYAFFVDGCSTCPGRGFIARMASERSEHRWVWVGGERSSLGGDKDHERSEYRTGDLLLWEQGGCEDKTMSEKIFERTSTCLTRRGS